ncbi:DUF664 domain-containing protein [Solicola sp. PLA-1-18]|uniref:mycothiol transferase n=1 Tax=Solicola sp. PLA-1-18 TaxID=3380532 RepID=UPI003B78108E
MAVPTTFPEPSSATSDPAALLGRYLDFYRGELTRGVRSLDDEGLRTSRLPSGWTPLELLAHLVHVEQRWIVWGFLGREVAEPWGDEVDGRWVVPDGVDVESLLGRLDAGAAVTSEVLATSPLDALATPGGRWTDDLPTLSWTCFHVLQEYARHVGHLDVAVELAGGSVGEGA